MKHIVKLLILLVAVSAFWIGLLETVVPRSYALLVRISSFMICLAIEGMWYFSPLLSFDYMCHLVTFQLPVYFIVSLGCYGLLMVGVGLMHFPTCPQEAVLLQKVLNPFP